jgi:hypothetical protein
MRILTPDDVKTDIKNKKGDVLEMSLEMSKENAKLVRQINLTKTEAENVRKVMEKKIAEFEDMIKQRKIDLQNEVKALEKRRNEATRPIDEMHREAEVRLTAAKFAEENNLKKEKELQEKSDEIQEMREDLVDREAWITEKEQESEKRSNDLKTIEERLNLQNQNLADKWATYYDTISKTQAEQNKIQQEITAKENENKKFSTSLAETVKTIEESKRILAIRQEEFEKIQYQISKDKERYQLAVAKFDSERETLLQTIEIGRKENEQVRSELIKEKSRLDEKEREIADRYKTLARATQEIENKKREYDQREKG